MIMGSTYERLRSKGECTVGTSYGDIVDSSLSGSGGSKHKRDSAEEHDFYQRRQGKYEDVKRMSDSRSCESGG